MPSRIAFPNSHEPVAPVYIKPGKAKEIPLGTNEPFYLAVLCDPEDGYTQVGIVDKSVELDTLVGSDLKTSGVEGVEYLESIYETDAEVDASELGAPLPEAYVILSHFRLSSHR